MDERKRYPVPAIQDDSRVDRRRMLAFTVRSIVGVVFAFSASQPLYPQIGCKLNSCSGVNTCTGGTWNICTGKGSTNACLGTNTCGRSQNVCSYEATNECAGTNTCEGKSANDCDTTDSSNKCTGSGNTCSKANSDECAKQNNCGTSADKANNCSGADSNKCNDTMGSDNSCTTINCCTATGSNECEGQAENACPGNVWT